QLIHTARTIDQNNTGKSPVPTLASSGSRLVPMTHRSLQKLARMPLLKHLGFPNKLRCRLLQNVSKLYLPCVPKSAPWQLHWHPRLLAKHSTTMLVHSG